MDDVMTSLNNEDEDGGDEEESEDEGSYNEDDNDVEKSERELYTHSAWYQQSMPARRESSASSMLSSTRTRHQQIEVTPQLAAPNLHEDERRKKLLARCHTNTTSNNYTTSDEDVVALMQQLRDQRKQRAVQQVTEALDQHQDDEEMRNNFTQQNSTSMSHVKQDYLDDETPTGDIIPASDVLTTHKRFQRNSDSMSWRLAAVMHQATKTALRRTPQCNSSSHPFDTVAATATAEQPHEPLSTLMTTTCVDNNKNGSFFEAEKRSSSRTRASSTRCDTPQLYGTEATRPIPRLEREVIQLPSSVCDWRVAAVGNSRELLSSSPIGNVVGSRPKPLASQDPNHSLFEEQPPREPAYADSVPKISSKNNQKQTMKDMSLTVEQVYPDLVENSVDDKVQHVLSEDGDYIIDESSSSRRQHQDDTVSIASDATDNVSLSLMSESNDDKEADNSEIVKHNDASGKQSREVRPVSEPAAGADSYHGNSKQMEGRSKHKSNNGHRVSLLINHVTDTDNFRQVTVTYHWTIPNFEHGPSANGMCRTSSTFSSANHDKDSKWLLVLYPNGHQAQHEGQVGLYLKLQAGWQRDIPVQATFTILTVNKESSDAAAASAASSTPVSYLSRTIEQKFSVGEEWGFGSFVDRQRLLNDAVRVFNRGAINISVEVVYVAARLRGFRRFVHNVSQLWRFITHQHGRDQSNTSVIRL